MWFPIKQTLVESTVSPPVSLQRSYTALHAFDSYAYLLIIKFKFYTQDIWRANKIWSFYIAMYYLIT